MKKIITKINLFLILGLPAIASAQVKSRTIKGIANDLTKFLSSAVMPLLFSVALAMFIWGIVDFINHAENSNERKKGKQRMLWGIIGLTVMVTYLGLTSVLTQTVFNEGAGLPKLYTNN